MNRKRDRLQLCRHCHNPMKYCGSRIWYCKKCHIRVRILNEPEYAKDEKGNFLKNFFGKLNLLGFNKRITEWRSSR